MWFDISVAAVAFTFGFFVSWYLRLKRPFSLHMRFPSGQVLAFSIPTEQWVYVNGEEPMRLQINDDGQPPPPQIPQPQPPAIAQANPT